MRCAAVLGRMEDDAKENDDGRRQLWIEGLPLSRGFHV